RAEQALEWLRTAYVGAPGNGEIAASLAHALARAGKLNEAKKVLVKAMRRGGSREHAALWKWLEKGAPAHGLAGGGRAHGAGDAEETDDEAEADAAASERPSRRGPSADAAPAPKGSTGLNVRVRNVAARAQGDGSAPARARAERRHEARAIGEALEA